VAVSGDWTEDLTEEQLLALSDERDRELQARLDAERAGFDRGRGAGHDEGRLEAEQAEQAAWHAVAEPVARGGPSHAELEELRWGPGGREHFGDPRPGDFRGHREIEEREAG
jgi:hypothetical protein